MQTLTLDANMVAKLRDVKRPVRFEDERGTVLGYFTPANAEPDELQADPHYEYIPAPITRAELERRKKTFTGEGYTLKQTWERILEKETNPESRAILEDAIRKLAERDRCDTP